MSQLPDFGTPAIAAAASREPASWARLLDTTGFPARWECGTGWSAALGWTHIVADILIWASYFAIPAALAVYMIRRREVLFPAIGWLFVSFIALCGAGHLLEAAMFWWPAYRLSGAVKSGTALVSVATAVALIPVLPRALALPGLARMNRELRAALALKDGLLQREHTLLKELEHRVRNNLAGLQGLILLYERSERDGPALAEALRHQVDAMLQVHLLMSPAPGMPISLEALIDRIASGVGADPEAFERRGTDVALRAKQAGALAMSLQELFTNSAKHGALAQPGGKIRLEWSTEQADGVHRLRMDWRESLPRPAQSPGAEGVGLQLLRGFARSELRGACEFQFHPDGMRWHLDAMLDAAEQIEMPADVAACA